MIVPTTLRRSALAALALATAAQAARAADPRTPVTTTATAPPPGAAPAPAPPYSLPWQLRPITPGTVVRSDTSVASYENAGNSGFTVASILTASYKLTPSLAPLVRLGMVRNEEPGPTLGAGTAFVNPLVGVTWGHKLSDEFRLAAFGGAAIPIGMGGGKSPAMDEIAAAVPRGIAARSSMDNAMFAVNYFVPLGGLDLAWVAHRMTVQLEVTMLELLRARNEMFAPESTRTNFTAGLHVGGFVASFLSLGAELRYQRWLSTPASVTKDPTTRDTLTVAFGPRLHFRVAGKTWLRPGLSYARGLDDPLDNRKYNILQVDVPVAF